LGLSALRVSVMKSGISMRVASDQPPPSGKGLSARGVMMLTLSFFDGGAFWY
jgi:hypothetical protein